MTASSGASRSTSMSGSSASTTRTSLKDGRRRPRQPGDLGGAEGGRREAHRRVERQIRHRPLRAQGRGHRRRAWTASSSPTAARCSNDDGSCGLTSDAVGRGARLSAARSRPMRRRASPTPPPATCASSSSTARSPSSSGRRWSSRPCRSPSSTGTSSTAPRPRARPPIGTYGGWNLVIYKSSPHKEAAWKFIQFLTREDVNGTVVDLIPANVKAADAFLKANRKGPDRIIDAAQQRRAAPAVAALSRGLRHRGDAGPGRLRAAWTRRRPPKRPATRSTP